MTDLSFLKFNNPSEETFQEIAGKIFNEYAIVAGNRTYRLTEIEFYWHAEGHKDESTYARTYTDPKCGEWFFHYSGVDISLGAKRDGAYGGILIRGMQDVTSPYLPMVNSGKEKKNFNGPQICAMRLFSGGNAFSAQGMPHLISARFDPEEILAVKKKGLGKNAEANGMHEKLYNFSINPKP